MKIRYRVEALSDIDEISQYIQERSPAGAQNTLRAIYAGIHLIGVRPMACEQTTIQAFE